MKSIIKTSKRSIIAILTLCILLGIAGTCFNVTAMAAETTATIEEVTATIEEVTATVEETTATVEENAVATEDTAVVTEETTQELVPMMARACDCQHTPGAVITETRTCSCGKTYVYQYQNCTVCGRLLRVIGKCCN